MTVSEIAVVTAVYSVVVTVGVHRDLHLWRDLPRLMWQSMMLVGAILIILGMAMGLTNYLIDAQVPKHLPGDTRHHHQPYWLLTRLECPVAAGRMYDGYLSAIVVVVPLITPIAAQFGVHPLHLGVIFLTNLEIGYSTPPVGLNLFLGSLRFERPISQLYRASWPFLVVLLLALLVITYIPELSLGLVRALGYAEVPAFRR